MVDIANFISQLRSELTIAERDTRIARIEKIINESPTLQQEIRDFNGTLKFKSDELTRYDIDSNTLIVYKGDINSAIADDLGHSTVGVTIEKNEAGALQAANTLTISPEGTFVGNLAHELGHFEDKVGGKDLKTRLAEVPEKLGNIGLGFGLKTGLSLLSEGKAIANTIKVAKEIASNSSNQRLDDIFILSSDYLDISLPIFKRVTLVNNNITDPTSPKALGEFATHMANNENPGGNPQNYLLSYVNPNQTQGHNSEFSGTITNGTITVSPNGELQLLSVDKVNSANVTKTTYNYAQRSRIDYDASGNAVNAYYYEKEPNTTQGEANQLGPLFPGEVIKVSGHVNGTSDPFDYYNYTPSVPGKIHILSTAGANNIYGTDNTVTVTQAGAPLLDWEWATGNADFDYTIEISYSSADLTPGSVPTLSSPSASSTMSFLAASESSHIISAQVSGETLVGSSPFGDTFRGTSANLNGDLIQLLSGNDVIDVTDMDFARATLSYSGTDNTGTLSLTDGMRSTHIGLSGDFNQSAFHLASDLHGGTDITYG